MGFMLPILCLLLLFKPYREASGGLSFNAFLVTCCQAFLVDICRIIQRLVELSCKISDRINITPRTINMVIDHRRLNTLPVNYLSLPSHS